MSDATMETTVTALDLDAIEARHAAAIPGPYFWHGNTDYHSVNLCGRQPGIGICEVISTVKVDHKATDPEVERSIESMIESDLHPPGYSGPIHHDFEISGKKRGAHRECKPDESCLAWEAAVREYVVKTWLDGGDFADVASDQRLSLTTPDYILKPVEEQVVYQTARSQGLPDNTPRNHPKVYRADVVDVNNPSGKFLAASWADVRDLIAEVKALRAENAQLKEGAAR